MEGIRYNNMPKIDEKDKQIMKALFIDGRISIADIAKKTGIRRDSIARRIKRMQNEKVINGFIPVINPPALGYLNVAIIMIRIKSVDEEAKKQFLSKLVENKFVVHVSTLIGKFDFYCSLVYKDVNHLNQTIEAMKTYVPNFIEAYEFFQVVDEPKFEMMEQLLS